MFHWLLIFLNLFFHGSTTGMLTNMYCSSKLTNLCPLSRILKEKMYICIGIQIQATLLGGKHGNSNI